MEIAGESLWLKSSMDCETKGRSRKRKHLKEWRVKAIDFKQTYLNAPLAEEIWSELLSGEVVNVCKAVYGLRQSAIQWWKELR